MFASNSFVEAVHSQGGHDLIRSVVNELVTITERLGHVRPEDQGIANAASPVAPVANRHAHLVALADEELRRRKLRSRFLPAHYFGEAAWSMLLDLYVSEFRERPVATTSACIAADVPATTALRWLDALEQQSLIERYDSGHDRRVKFIRLTIEGRQAVEAILSGY